MPPPIPFEQLDPADFAQAKRLPKRSALHFAYLAPLIGGGGKLCVATLDKVLAVPTFYEYREYFQALIALETWSGQGHPSLVGCTRYIIDRGEPQRPPFDEHGEPISEDSEAYRQAAILRDHLRANWRPPLVEPASGVAIAQTSAAITLAWCWGRDFLGELSEEQEAAVEEGLQVLRQGLGQ